MTCIECTRRRARPHFSRCVACINALYLRMGFRRRGL